MRNVAFAVGLVVIPACASVPTPQTATGGTIRDSRAAFSNADANCRAAGRFAVIRNIDRVSDTVTYDCVPKP
jgi:hypothetical protein